MARTPSKSSKRSSKGSGKAAPAARTKKQAKPSLTTNNRSAADLEKDRSYVGRRVSKKFDGEVYNGKVTKFVQKHRLWGIKYDDGDAEEMDWRDVSKAMDLHDAINKKKGGGGGGKNNTKAQAKMATSPPRKIPEDPAVVESPPPAAESPPAAAAAAAESASPVASVASVDIAEVEAAEKSESEDVPGKSEPSPEAAAAKEQAAEKMSVDPPEQAAEKMMLDPSERKFGRANRAITPHVNLFAQNPCRIRGSVPRHPAAYPNYHKGKGSFGFLIQRLSDRNYAMRALCMDGHGAEFDTYQKPGVNYISVVWHPPTNLEHHGKEETIVDGCHLDLIDSKDGKTYLTGPNLEAAIVEARKPVECVFLNGAQSNPGSEISADDIASAVSRCKDTLLCASMTECKMNANLVSALASCPKLRGLTLENCQLRGEGDARPTDESLAAVLRSCPDLRWVFVKSSLFGGECWNVLAEEGACPNLEVLWVDAPVHTVDRTEVARGEHNTIRRALGGRGGAGGKLRLCMINPDHQNISRYIMGGGKDTDRLNGTERSPESKEMIKMNGFESNAGGRSYLNTV